MAALPPPHKTLRDVVFRGRRIPKDTQVAYLGYAMNHDGRKFSDPDVFNPERFLDSGGRFRRSEHLFNFGLGKRRCPGEVLGSAEVFMFVASIVQNFR